MQPLGFSLGFCVPLPKILFLSDCVICMFCVQISTEDDVVGLQQNVFCFYLLGFCGFLLLVAGVKGFEQEVGLGVFCWV